MNSRKKLKSLISKGGPLEENKEEITNYIKDRKVKRKFVAFLSKYSEGSFEGSHKKAAHCYIRKRELKECAGAIYDARSRHLHKGVPMYISSDLDMEEAYLWDVDPCGDMTVDRRKIPKNEKLPRMRWFEGIVNHCLRRYLEERLREVGISIKMKHLKISGSAI